MEGKVLIENLLVTRLNNVVKVMNKAGNKGLQQQGISIDIEQVPPLMVIYLGLANSQQQVADILERDKSSIKRTLEWLEKNGYISILPDKTDKRKNIVTATPKGKKLGEKTMAMVIEMNRQIEQAIGLKELKAFENTLEKIKTIIDTIN